MCTRITAIKIVGAAMVIWGLCSCRGSAFLEEGSESEFNRSTNPRDTDSSPADSDAAAAAQLGIGRPCETSEACFPGIICSSFNNTCQYPGTPGTYPAGSECQANLFCSLGLACSAEGKCVQMGSEGTGQIGDACSELSDCALGYICEDGHCFGYDPVYWEGASCQAQSEEGAFVAHFDVNRESGEFYRMPFPNDGAFVDGHIDLSGHTDPGVLDPELGNITGAYIDYIQTVLKGFGTQSNIFFRMSHKPDWDSLDNGENAYIVNIDPASPSYGEKHRNGYWGNTAKQMYICSNWIALKPSTGRPLDPGTTYAAVLETSVRDINGNSLTSDDNFKAMLKGTGPGSGRAQSTWQAFAPLRNWVDDKNIDTSKMAVASVFTTQTFDVIPKLRAKVRSEGSPALVNGKLSADSSDGDYTRYTGTVTVPFYQKGVRPFASFGGQFEFDGTGAPIRVSNDEVPFAVTVPTGSMPSGGWPVFLYAHGTGGDENSFVDNQVAEEMSKLGVAVISMLQVQHGVRRGISADQESRETDPAMLFYNFRNPHAAVGNNLQAAADYFQLVRLVENFASVTGENITFNVNKLYYFGHSQGTQGQYLAAVHEPLIKGIVLSGAGGNLIESLLNKKQPIDLSIAVSFLLMDPNVDGAHPVLSLLQASMDVVDPVNYSPAAFENKWPGQTYPGRDLFMSFGIDDTYAPESTQEALAKSLFLHMDFVDDDHEIGSLHDIGDELPFSGSNKVDGARVTAVGMQYRPDGNYDGHFVLFRNKDAQKQLKHFVETMVADDTVAEIIKP